MKLSYILAAGALMVSSLGFAQVNKLMKVSTVEGSYLFDATDATNGAVEGNFMKINGARLTTIQDLKSISFTDEADYRFVKPEKSGSGDGSSWENAMGIVEFCATICTKMDYDAEMEQAKAVDGKIFCFAGGEYPINGNVDAYRSNEDNANYVKIDFANQNAPVQINIIGGFDPASTGKDVTKRDKTKFATVFNGNNPTEGDTAISDSKDYAGFYLQENITLNVSSVTFKFFYGHKGGVFYLHGGANGHAQLNTLECTFADNRANDGGAVVNQSKRNADCHSSFKFVNTSITGSKAPWGAVAKLLNATATNYMVNCDVYGNRSDNGGLFRMENDSRLVTLDCNFHDNEMRGSGGNYGCVITQVWAENGACDYRADGCRFVNNHTQTRNVINGTASRGRVWLNNCYFENNVGDDGNSATVGVGGVAELAMNNCTFVEQNAQRSIVGGNFVGLILNSTIIGNPTKGILYVDDESYCKVGNTIMLSETNADAVYFNKPVSTVRLMGYDIIGTQAGGTLQTDGDTNLVDQKWADGKFTFNQAAGLVEWDGEWAGHQNANVDEFFTIYDDPNGYDAFDFIEWIDQMGSIKVNSDFVPEEVFDATGAPRNLDSIWAGAYQK